MENDYKYLAFISYSHKDSKWGKWLHKSLEKYKIPKRIVQSQDSHKALPKRLFPIFRDREELPTASNLSESINQALIDSNFLIVICSPNSASSHWVNEEIVTYKKIGRDDRIICLIVDGEPNASDKLIETKQECFPEALRFKVSKQGTILKEKAEPVSADLRPGRDTKNDAKLRIIAGLLGIGFDELKRRELIRYRRRLTGVAAASVSFMMILIGLTLFSFSERNKALVANEKSREQLVANLINNEEYIRAIYWISDFVAHNKSYKSGIIHKLASYWMPSARNLNETIRINSDRKNVLVKWRGSLYHLNQSGSFCLLSSSPEIRIYQPTQSNTLLMVEGKNRLSIFDRETMQNIYRLEIPQKYNIDSVYYLDKTYIVSMDYEYQSWAIAMNSSNWIFIRHDRDEGKMRKIVLPKYTSGSGDIIYWSKNTKNIAIKFYDKNHRSENVISLSIDKFWNELDDIINNCKQFINKNDIVFFYKRNKKNLNEYCDIQTKQHIYEPFVQEANSESIETIKCIGHNLMAIFNKNLTSIESRDLTPEPNDTLLLKPKKIDSLIFPSIRNESDLWYSIVPQEILKQENLKENAFIMKCNENNLREFDENYLKNHPGYDDLDLEMMWARKHDCYWTSYHDSKFYFILSGVGARLFGYTVFEFDINGKLKNEQDIEVLPLETIPKESEYWRRSGRYVLKGGSNFGDHPPFHIYDLENSQFVDINYIIDDKAVFEKPTDKGFIAFAGSKKGKLAIAQKYYVWIYDVDVKKNTLAYKMRIKTNGNLSCIAFKSENELILVDKENNVELIEVDLISRSTSLRWSRNRSLPNDFALRGIAISSSGIVALYSLYDVWLLLADSGIPVSKSLKLENTPDPSQGIERIVWINGTIPAIDLGPFWLVRRKPYTSIEINEFASAAINYTGIADGVDLIRLP